VDFWKTVGVLLRRWYVAVPVFVVSLGLAGAVFAAVTPQYESTGTIVLTSPTDGANVATNPANAAGPSNPLLEFGGSLVITTQLLTQSLGSPSVIAEIVKEGGSSTFQAGDGGTGGPFVVIVADAPTQQQAEHTVTLALQYAKNELVNRQQSLKAPPSTFIGTQDVVTATPATAKIGGKSRAAGVALVLGLVASLGSAYGIESVLVNRRRRAAARAKAETPSDTPDPARNGHREPVRGNGGADVRWPETEFQSAEPFSD
jgi:hypothetical protein